MNSLRSSAPLINSPVLCYLSPNAQQAVALLMSAGLDQDLAIGVLEQLWNEEDIFCLEEDSGRGE